MVDSIKDPDLVIGFTVATDGAGSELLAETVDDLDAVKEDHHTSLGATRYVRDHVRLQRGLHHCHVGREGVHKMQAGAGHFVEHAAPPLVHSHVCFIHGVKEEGVSRVHEKADPRSQHHHRYCQNSANHFCLLCCVPFSGSFNLLNFVATNYLNFGVFF